MLERSKLACIERLKQEARALRVKESSIGTLCYQRVRVVCPSQEFSKKEMSFGTARWLSVARGLWELLNLGSDGNLKIILLMAPQLPIGVEDYLMQLAPGSAQEMVSRRNRFILLALDDNSSRHLSDKFLSALEVLDELREVLALEREQGKEVEALSCYQSSANMALLARRLDIPLGEASPSLLHHGSKFGSKRIFSDLAIPTPASLGRVVYNSEELGLGLLELSQRFPKQRRWIIKLDSGFGSGHGNFVVNPYCGGQLQSYVRGELSRTRLGLHEFEVLLGQFGAIVEAFVEPGPKAKVSTPSCLCYLYRNIDGRIVASVLGTHEQVLNGPTNQAYEACTFPARCEYRSEIVEYSRRVIQRLAELGLVGHLSIDYLCIGGRGGSEVLALEINLRQTGTTHPCRTFLALVRGELLENGSFLDPTGREKFYLGTDDIVDARYIGITIPKLLGELTKQGSVGYDAELQVGVIPHLWLSLEHHGKIGGTFIANSKSQALALKKRFIDTLDDLVEARRVQL